MLYELTAEFDICAGIIAGEGANGGPFISFRIWSTRSPSLEGPDGDESKSESRVLISEMGA